MPILNKSNNGSDGGVASQGTDVYWSGDERPYAYQVFDGDDGSSIDFHLGSYGTVAQSWVSYAFTQEVVVNRIAFLYGDYYGTVNSIKIQRSDNGTSWTDVYTISSGIANHSGEMLYFDIPNTTSAKYWKFQGVSTTRGYKIILYTLQFYGYKA